MNKIIEIPTQEDFVRIIANSCARWVKIGNSGKMSREDVIYNLKEDIKRIICSEEKVGVLNSTKLAEDFNNYEELGYKTFKEYLAKNALGATLNIMQYIDEISAEAEKEDDTIENILTGIAFDTLVFIDGCLIRDGKPTDMYEIIPGAIEDGNLVFNLDNRWMCMYEYHDLFYGLYREEIANIK